MLFKQTVKDEIKVPADMAYLAKTREFVITVGKKHGFDDKVIGTLKLATDEAVTNVIRHAYRDVPGPNHVTLRAIAKSTSLTICIIDQGRTFDPRNAKAPDMAEYVKIGKKGGLGIFMLQKLMDEIEYHVTSEGNELRLIKNRTQPARKASNVLKQINLKNRYAIVSASALTLLVLVGYFIFAPMQLDSTRSALLQRVRAVSATLSTSSADDMAQFDDLAIFEIALALKKDNPLLHSLYIVDTTRHIFASSERQTLGIFTQPDNPREVEFETDAAANDTSAAPQALLRSAKAYHYEFNGQRVYDVVTPVYRNNQVDPQNLLGTAHVLTTEEQIEEALLPTRLVALSIALFTLMVGYGGIALLVARIISPFQRLTDWIRTAGHETVSDDVDIDTSNEVGEIAQAFSEMATKFRKAQIGLVQQKELQKEIQVAQEIQHMLLPPSFPQVEGYDLATHYESAKEVGGDLFDFVVVDDRTIGIVVADVSGKGVPGSLVMTMIRTALRLEARGNKNPGEVLAKVNDFVVDDMKKGMFVTMFYIILDSRNRRIHYASAGHNPMILHRCSTDQTYYLNPKGFPVGISLPDRTLFGKSIEIDTLQLNEDDILIAYTDGITEAMNPARDLFGEERFLESIRKYAHLGAKDFVENMRQEILSFTKGAPQNDDITFVAIKDNMMAGDVIFNLRKNLFDAIASGVSVKDACKKAGVSTSTYYKWKKKFEEFGIEGLKVKEVDQSVELKHLSIQQRAKIMNIIRENPDAGPKVISDLLNTEAYGFTRIPEKRIYDELVRMRLNTAEKRKAFVTQRTRGRRQFKMPGTPLVTMDGQVIKSDSTATDSLVQQIIKQRQQPTEEKTEPQPSERTES